MAAEPAAALTEALLDEYKARATYRAVIRAFGDVRPFINIVDAEDRHVQALLGLFRSHGIPVPEDEFASSVGPPSSLHEACRDAVRAEIDNVTMYERLLESTNGFPDVQAVLRRLQRASSERHLPAFQRCVDRLASHRAGTASRSSSRGGRQAG